MRDDGERLAGLWYLETFKMSSLVTHALTLSYRQVVP